MKGKEEETTLKVGVQHFTFDGGLENLLTGELRIVVIGKDYDLPEQLRKISKLLERRLVITYQNDKIERIELENYGDTE